MKLRILPSALADLTRGNMFYARLDPGLGEYFLNSIFGDIDSLVHHAGSQGKVFGYHRLLARHFPFAIDCRNDCDVCVVWRVLDCRQNASRLTRALK